MLLKLALLGSALAVLGEAENDYTVQGLFLLMKTIYFFRLSSELANGIATLRRSKRMSSSKSSIRYEKNSDLIKSVIKVVDGGDLDISFQAFDPKGKQLFTDHRQEDGLHSVSAESNPGGDFQICFDNRHSRFQAKVFLFFFVNNLAGDKKNI